MDATTARLAAQELRLTEAGERGHVQFHGTSMQPLLREADEVLVAPVAWTDIRPGDVVTYRLDDRLPTCRVVRRHREWLLLRGDNWPAREFHAWPEDILGRALGRRRNGVWLSRDDPEWRYRRGLALARYRVALVRRRLRHVLRGPYVALRRMVGAAAPWVRVDGTALGARGGLALVREARAGTPRACLEVRMRSGDLTPAVAAELVDLAVSRVVVTAVSATDDPRPPGGAAALAQLRRARGAPWPVIRMEYPLDLRSYEGLEVLVREMAAHGVDELSLTAPAFDAVVASDRGARLRRAVKLSEAFRIGLGRTTPGPVDGRRFGPDRLAEILT